MSLSVGIVGLPNVGKSTLFNTLRSAQGKLSGLAQVGNYPFTTIEPNVGIVPVPDARLIELSKVIKVSEKLDREPPIVPATCEFVDIAGIVKGANEGAGLGNKFLAHIREVNAVVHVVRAFRDTNIIKEGSVNPKSDFEIVKTELDLADLEHPDAPPLARKPILVVVNVDEDDLKQTADLEVKYAQELSVEKDQIVVICAKVEAELAELSEEDAKEYLHELGIDQSGLERLITKAFATLGLMTFLTAGEKEVRAWTIRRDTKAVDAAGVIHTDFMKKFIKADVVKYEDFVRINGWKNAREKGLVRSEGRDYIMQEGDVVEFKIGT